MIKETFIRILYNKTGFLRNIFINTTILFFVVFLISLTSIRSGFIKKIEDNLNIIAFFKKETDEKNILEIIHKIKSLDTVQNVKYISEEEALRKFNTSYELRELAYILSKNPLPASIEIKVKNCQYLPVINKLKEFKEIEEIKDKKYEYKKLNSIIINSKKCLILTIFLFSTIAFIILNFKTHLTIHPFYSQIRTLKFIGASSLFIYLPFLIQNFIEVLISGLIVFSIHTFSKVNIIKDQKIYIILAIYFFLTSIIIMFKKKS